MKLLSLIFILSFTLITKSNAQTIDLDSRKVHIGDSIESVKKQFDPKIYKFITDSSSYPIYSYLYKYINPKKGGGEEPIAQLKFSFDEKDLKGLISRGHIYSLHSVQKYWDNGTGRQNGTNEFVQKIFDIIQRNGIDKYSLDISTTKFSEQGADSKSISLKISSNVKLTIEFNGKNNCILSETISQEEDTTSGRYVLLYYDTKNLFGKDKIIYNEFPSEKEAEAKKNEFDMGYFMKNYLPPTSRIVRFRNEQLTELPALK
jgi:hypothetical protein